MNEDFKHLKKWVEMCPVEAAMRIEELENKLGNRNKEINMLHSVVKEDDETKNRLLEIIYKYENAHEYSNNAIYTQQCTMNHMENTEYEKGMIRGLIIAGNIIDKAFKNI